MKNPLTERIETILNRDNNEDDNGITNMNPNQPTASNGITKAPQTVTLTGPGMNIRDLTYTNPVNNQ